MRRVKLKGLVTCATAALMLAAGPVSAAPGGVPGANPNAPGQSRRVAAPEIDAASGISAVALLAGVVLMLRERSRSRRS